MSGKVVRSCCVCSNKESDADGANISYHRFPTNPEILSQWIEVLPLSNYCQEKSFVCSQHFRPQEISMSHVLDRKILQSHAVPSIFELIDNKDQENDSSVIDEGDDDKNEPDTCTVSDGVVFQHPTLHIKSNNTSTLTMSESFIPQPAPEFMQIKEETSQLIISPDTSDLVNILKEEEISIESPVPWQDPSDDLEEDHFSHSYDAITESKQNIIFSDPKPQWVTKKLQTRKDSRKRCCACPKSSANSEDLLSFPSNNETREKWKTALKEQGIKITSFDNLYLCPKHFQTDPNTIERNGPCIIMYDSSSNRSKAEGEIQILDPKTINKSVESLLSAKVVLKRLDPSVAISMGKSRKRHRNREIGPSKSNFLRKNLPRGRYQSAVKIHPQPIINPIPLVSNKVPLLSNPVYKMPSYVTPVTPKKKKDTTATQADVFYVTRAQVILADRIVFPVNGTQYTFFRNSCDRPVNECNKLKSENKELKYKLKNVDLSFKAREYKYKTKAEDYQIKVRALRQRIRKLTNGMTTVEKKIAKMRMRPSSLEDELTPLMGDSSTLAKDVFSRLIAKLRNTVKAHHTQRILNFSMLLYLISVDAYNLVRKAFNEVLPHHRHIVKRKTSILQDGIEKSVLINMLKVVAENNFEATDEQLALTANAPQVEKESQNQEVILAVSNVSLPKSDSEILVTVDQDDLNYMRDNSSDRTNKPVGDETNPIDCVPSPLKKCSTTNKLKNKTLSSVESVDPSMPNISNSISESISKQVMYESTTVGSSRFTDISNSTQAANVSTNCSSLPYDLQTFSSVDTNSDNAMVPFSPSTVFSLDSNRYVISSNDGIIQSDGNILVPILPVSNSSGNPPAEIITQTVPSNFPNLAPIVSINNPDVYVTTVNLQSENSYIATDQLRPSIVYQSSQMSEQNNPQLDSYEYPSNLSIDESAGDVEMS